MKWLQNLVNKTSGFLDSYGLSLSDSCSNSQDKSTSPPGDSSPSPKATPQSFPELPGAWPADPPEEAPDASDPPNLPILIESGTYPSKFAEDFIVQGFVWIDNTSRNTLHQTAASFASPKNWFLQQPVVHKPYNTQAQSSHANMTVLKDMLKHVIPGSRHNSAARDPPPRCHPGTRTRILQDMNARIHDKSTRMIWLFGLASSGKSAIMQTIAETQSPHVINTTLFLSQANGRDDSNKILATLAYGFAVANPMYRHFCEELMSLDPDFLSLSMDEQFKRLFVQPFITLAIQDVRRWVVILDGLDECRNKAAACRIVGLIRDSILYQSTPLLWIISSRPEPHLRASFSKVRDSITSFWEQEVPIGSHDASEDVSRYLSAELAYIRELQTYPIPLPSSWPSDDELLSLTTKSSGFFGFASSAAKYIASVNPISRLQVILSSNFPLESLDSMYTEIMRNIPGGVLPNATAILGFYAVHQMLPTIYSPTLGDVKNPGFLALCNILGIKHHDGYEALHPLSSLLIVPSPEEAKDHGVTFCHPSFLQFLGDRSRSGSFSIDLEGELQRTWRCYLGILRQAKKADKNIDISWLPDDGTSPSELQQALLGIVQRGWISILMNCYDDCRQGACSKIMCMQNRICYCNELIGIFQELESIVLDCAEFEIGLFIVWITKHVEPRIKELLALEEMRLDRASAEVIWNNVYAKRPFRRVVSSRTTGASVASTLFGGAEAKPPVVDDGLQKTFSPLKELMEIYESVDSSLPATLIGRRSRRVVIGPITGRDPLGDVHYIAPW